MILFKFQLLLLLQLNLQWNVASQSKKNGSSLIEQSLCYSTATSCSSQFPNGNDHQLCYYHSADRFTWTDALDNCSTRTSDGTLIKIFSLEQFQHLQHLNSIQIESFWLGANNFQKVGTSEWRWLDGSMINDYVVKWCDNNTHTNVIGARCLVYDTEFQCVKTDRCSASRQMLCVSSNINRMKVSRNLIQSARLTFGVCASATGYSYANWWTYSMLLLNWFILICFFLILSNRFQLDKNTIILSLIFVIVSFILVIVFAIFWGLQYLDLVRYPPAAVILGCVAGTLLNLVIIIILSAFPRIPSSKSSMIIAALTMFVESFLMLGLILCIAYCSDYITLATTSLEKDIIASLLATLIAAITILCQTAILYMIDTTDQDRTNTINPIPVPKEALPKPTPMPVAQAPLPRNSQATVASNHQRATPMPTMKNAEKIERATSPVDYRILAEFYSDKPQDVHSYQLDGRHYVVYEGQIQDIDACRKDLVEAMLLQDPDGLREAIDRAKYSMHANALADDIHQAQSLVSKMV